MKQQALKKPVKERKKSTTCKERQKNENFEDLFKKSFILEDEEEEKDYSTREINLGDSEIAIKSAERAMVKSDNIISLDQTSKGDEVPKLLKMEIRSFMQEVLDGIQTELMKPMEQNAFFIAGKLVQENGEIKDKMEIVLRENERLRERLDILPASPEKVLEILEQKENVIRKADEEIKKKITELEVVWGNLRKHEKALSFLSNTQTRLRDREETLSEAYREMERKHHLLDEIRVQLCEKESSLGNVLIQQKQLVDTLKHMQFHLAGKEEEIEDLKCKVSDKDLAISDLQMIVVKERNKQTESQRENKRLEALMDRMKEVLRNEQARVINLEKKLETSEKELAELRESVATLQEAYHTERDKSWVAKLMGK